MNQFNQCQHQDCNNQGIAYQYPYEGESVICCYLHAKQAGFCPSCGGFFGGIESFDFGNGICEECESELFEDPSIYYVDE